MRTIKLAGKPTEKPKLDPAHITGTITKLQAAKGGKVTIFIEAEISDPTQAELKRLLDLQHGPVNVLFEEVVE